MMAEVFQEALSFFRSVEHAVEYLEMRIEHVNKLSIYIKSDQVNHSILEDFQGGYVRAYHRGRWGISMFDGFHDNKTKRAISSALENMGIIAIPNQASAQVLSPVRSVQAPVTEEKSPDSEFATVFFSNSGAPLIGRKQHACRLNTLLHASKNILGNPGVVSNQIDYMEICKKRLFIKKEAYPVLDESCFITFNIVPMLIRGNKTMNIYKNFALAGEGMDSFTVDENLSRQVFGAFSENALNLTTLTPGGYEVILDPETSGFLLHEILGHLLEADLLYNHPHYLEERIALGRAISVEELTIIDDPRLPHQAGSYVYDDEGNPAQKVYLVTDGRITGMMHSMDTAKRLNQENNGHARSIEYHLLPFVRMSNTYIEPRSITFEEMIADTRRGVYLKSCMLAKNDMEHFQLLPKEAYSVENGRIAAPIAPPVAYGNIFEVLQNIVAIGNDLQFFSVGCTKGYSDAWIPVSVGGVHLKIRKMLLGASML